MATLEELRNRIRTIDDLHEVVRTMKAMAQVGNRRYQALRASLQDVDASVDRALQALLQARRFQAWSDPLPSVTSAAAGRGVGMILFGTDHGLCGSFNEKVLGHARALCRQRRIAPADRHLAVVGARLEALLEAEGLPVDARFAVPTSVEGASGLVQDLLLLVQRWHLRPDAACRPLGTVLLLLLQTTSRLSSEPTSWSLLPLDPHWIPATGSRPWRSPAQPLLLQSESSLFAAIVREHLHVLLFRAVVESLASENSARLQAMHSAEQHIEERLDELRASYRRQRQDAITAELLDIVAGFEVLGRDG